jgi:hypothetical protein
MDRLKADFIASLPMQPERAAPVYCFERTERRVSGLWLGQTAKCYHIRRKREARNATLSAGTVIEKKFLKGERSG